MSEERSHGAAGESMAVALVAVAYTLNRIRRMSPSATT